MVARKIGLALTLFVFTSLGAYSNAMAADGSKSSEQQATFLNSPSPLKGATPGTFDSIASYLYASKNILIHTEDPVINRTKLNLVFSSAPTWRTVFDQIASQTKSSYRYDAKSGNWVFSAKPTSANTLAETVEDPPFTFTMAKGWTGENRGNYFSYHPPTLPVGMDVYWFGKRPKVADKDERESLALNSAKKISPNANSSHLRPATIDGVEAAYFECPTPRPGVTWRQWVFVKNGLDFLIVSSLPNNDTKSVADVKAMVASFKSKPQK